MGQKSKEKDYTSMTDPAIVKEIFLNIRQMRLNKNMSQEELSRKAGIDRTTISRMERGKGGTMLTMVQTLRALDKLDILNVFKEEPEISPLRILKLQEQRRKKASPKKASEQKEKLL